MSLNSVKKNVIHREGRRSVHWIQWQKSKFTEFSDEFFTGGYSAHIWAALLNNSRVDQYIVSILSSAKEKSDSSTFRFAWNQMHHFGRKYDEELITYTSYLFQLYTAEKQVFCLSNKTFIMLWRVLRFCSQCQFVCAQWHANVHLTLQAHRFCLDYRLGSWYVWFLNLRSYNS